MTVPASDSATTALRKVAKRRAVKQLLRCRLTDTDSLVWTCCDNVFDTREAVSRHVLSVHVDELRATEEDILEQLQQGKAKAERPQQEEIPPKYQRRRAPKGNSDPVRLDCQCLETEATAGSVLLFYRYTHVRDPVAVASWQDDLCSRLGLTGKIRVANEGINVTVGGTVAATEEYMEELASSELLDGLSLSKSHEGWHQRRHTFFKPSPGCRHVFDGLSVKVVEEICPLGVKDWVPRSMRYSILDGSSAEAEGCPKVQGLPPPQFHQLLEEVADKDDYIVLDTRNYYESRIGRFRSAICPSIRRFSSLPEYVHRNKDLFTGKKAVITYCTGGIRCEKASAWLMEELDLPVIMLDGGIHNYIEWVKGHEPASQAEQDVGSHPHDTERPVQSLFEGRNYVFDARQTLGVDAVAMSPCSFCSGPISGDSYKCIGSGCHLLVLCCDACHESCKDESASGKYGVYCCGTCRQMDRADLQDDSCEPAHLRRSRGRSRLCECEETRRAQLFGGENQQGVNC
ncbi:hypothetical protein BC832DRAFT_215790 [Gaertneriomyces semiglobifer]|nr:hypothetical protein BC832DRAFT_215790 [Gaertneriomyces semiglobifer]